MYVHYQFAHVIYTQMHIFYLHGDFWVSKIINYWNKKISNF